jgi:hypothetical protein
MTRFARNLLAVAFIATAGMALAPSAANAAPYSAPVTPHTAWHWQGSITCHNSIVHGHVAMMSYRPCSPWVSRVH